MKQFPYCAISPQSHVETTSGEVLQEGGASGGPNGDQTGSASSMTTGSAANGTTTNQPGSDTVTDSALQALPDFMASISGTPTASPTTTPSNGLGADGDNGFFSVCQADSDSPLCLLGQRSVGDVIAALLQFIFLIAVLLALGFLIYGGVRWITSGGDKAAVESARSMLIAAVVGLVLVALSFVILNFALQFLTGGSFADLTIPTILPE